MLDQPIRDHEWYISRRIACYEGGYPGCEAAFLSVEEYVELLEEMLDRAGDRLMGDDL